MFRCSVISRRSVQISCAIALSFCGALPAAGQIPERMTLRIHLNEPLCQESRDKVIREISVSINGRDGEFTPLEKVSDCEWEKQGIKTLNPDISFFSLRLKDKSVGDMGRTRCRKPKLLGTSTLEVWFGERGTGVVRQLAVKGSPLDYVRIVKAKIRDRKPEAGTSDVDCDETWDVPGSLVGVQVAIEDVRVQIFKKKEMKCGLALNASDRLTKAAKGTEIDYTKRLADIIADQGWEAKLCHAATYMPPETIEESLRGKKPSLTVKVN
ncbi:MAG: hypothetical protein DMF56_15925 [Acidobacteria bacterium]|nr:MAG: hypothetical protein DMF56_15925 [Acidobacteriota bacterium]